MKHNSRLHSIAIFSLLLLFSVLLAAACTTTLDPGESQEPDQSLATQEQPVSDPGGETSGGEDLGDMANFECPSSPEPFEMWFSHEVKFNTGVMGTWNIQTSGGILLSVAEGLSDQVKMMVLPGEVIVPGSVSAVFTRDNRTCSFEQDIEVISNVSGNCDRGVIKLDIVENWGDVDTEMTCCDDDGCDPGPFNWMLPVVQFTGVEFTAANGYKVTKPFSGGSGTLTWWIQPSLVPEPISD